METPRLSKENTLLVALMGFAVAGFCFGLALLINLLFYTDLEVAVQLALQLSNPPLRRWAMFQALEAGIWSRGVTIGGYIFFYGLWPLWIITTLMIIRWADDVTSSNFWDAAIRGAPAWMKWFVALLMLLSLPIECGFFVGGCAFILAFYWATVVVLYATMRKLWAPKQLESEKQEES